MKKVNMIIDKDSKFISLKLNYFFPLLNLLFFNCIYLLEFYSCIFHNQTHLNIKSIQKVHQFLIDLFYQTFE